MRKGLAALFMLCFILAGFGVSMAENDRKGSKDHPLLSRMPDFFIEGYEEREFDKHEFITDGTGRQRTRVEGHYYHLTYKLNKGAAGPGELKIRRNIQEALRKIGGKVVFDEDFNRVSTIVLQKEGKETWIEVRTWPTLYRLWIVEKEAMKQEVVADAAAMGNDLNATGHVPVYGIYFDTGKSEVKPESDAAIAEIAKLLRGDTTLRLYVVGHTDNVGSFDANMKLSKDRADAVVKALSGKHGIASVRMKAFGVSSLSPVTSNETEDGRAKNRRVELVKQ